MSTIAHSTTAADLDTLAIDLFSTRYGLTLEDSYPAALAMVRNPAQAERALGLIARHGCTFAEALAAVRASDACVAEERDPQAVAQELAQNAHTAGDTRCERALNKAALHLAQGTAMQWAMGDLLIASGTRAGIVHRVHRAGEVWACSCEAATNGRDCWHAAAAQVLTIARPTLAAA